MTFNIILFITVTLIGGYLGYKSKFPLGVVIGSMLAVGLFKYFGILTLERSTAISFSVQVSLGAILGLSLIKLNKKQVISLGKSVLVVIAFVLIFTLCAGIVVSYLTGFDEVLSILTVAPGAVVEVATIAEALNLDSPSVVLVHLVRVIVIMSLFPFLMKLAIKISKKEKCETE
ncbi:AbrB family transcriptional regulator [Bacillaceae bacterium W0354]